MSKAFDEADLAGLILKASEGIDDTARARATRHLLDTVGVAIAGAAEPAPRIVIEALAGGADGAPCAIFGTTLRAGAQDAVLCNAMSGHLHDFDDDEAQVSYSHVSVPVMAAVWADAERSGAGGRAVVDAYLLGVETMLFFGRLLNPEHYARGWHASATLGVFGAAAAVSVLRGMPQSGLAAALALAATMSSGVRSAFGSDGKPFQLARAAQSGYLAADLAERGLVARDTIFGPLGFLDLYDGERATPQEIGRAAARFGAPFGLIDPGVTIKAFPSCTATHTAIEMAIALARESGAGAQDVEAIRVGVGRGVPRILIHDRPSSALQGKFSMPFCVAGGFHFGRMGIAEFKDASIALPEIAALIPRVSMVERDDQSDLLSATMELTLKDGRTFTREIRDPMGSPARPLSDADLRAKFLSCAAPVLGDARAEAAHEALRHLLEAKRLPVL